MDLPLQPWLTSNCVSLNQRDALARFWLAAPTDLMESFWNSPLGAATKDLVKQLRPESSFNPEQVALRNALNNRLSQGLQNPLAPQLMLANWLYSPPGLMKVANPHSQLPAWLVPAYLELYEAPQPNAYQPSAIPQQYAPPSIPQPDFGVFPHSLQELVGNRIQLNRMLGLSNLYYIDPEDQEILQELLQLRFALAEAIERCPEYELEGLWNTDLGDRYWAMVRSGVQKEPLASADDMKKQAVTRRLQPSQGGGFGTPGALNAFLVAMLYFPPGTMQVEAAQQKLPAWLFGPYQQIFAEPLAAQP